MYQLPVEMLIDLRKILFWRKIKNSDCAAAIVGSRPDYCNSLLAGTSVSNLARLQLVQNTLARVVAQKPRFCHTTPVLTDLHWLPIRHRINFKIATIAFKVLHFQVVLIRCLGHLEQVTMSSFIHFRSSCFQEETQASSFFKYYSMF